jgi:hypothetical protein
MQAGKRRGTIKAIIFTVTLAIAPAAAAASDAASLQELRAELERLKSEQAARAQQMQRLEARLEEVAATLGSAADTAAPAHEPASAGASAPPESAQRLRVGGDLRLRYEGNTGIGDAPDWSRGVLRARLRAQYRVAEGITVGGQLATGDPDDPNSADVTLSNFADDLDFSLDQAYVRVHSGGLDAWGGKFPLPFVRSDLVWDGDVSPQGVGAIYRAPFPGGAALRLAGLYFLVDQSVAGSDSSMIGAQLAVELPLTGATRLELAAAQYDYSLASVAGADAGDFRSNVIGPDGRYVSDFDLLDGIAAVDYAGLGERWPLRASLEYVYNRGARVSGDTGYSIELTAGRNRERGDWRFNYAYSMAEVDAVLAAFSHDNTTIGTNYRQHGLTLSYSILDNLVLDTVWYRYRPKDAEFAAGSLPDEWLDRWRVNLLATF